MKPILEVGTIMGLSPDAIIPYGPDKAKISLDAIREDEPRGKLVVVTGMTPTPAGEGKTTTTIGLTQALGHIGKRPVATLREPSLGPVFGIKGGGTGGGASRVIPEDEINLHFTGDAHAIGSAHNLLAALTDNAVQRDAISDMHPQDITWRRVTHVGDRALRSIATGLGGSANAPVRDTGFDIVAASEIMAILALATDLDDLRCRLEQIVVGFQSNGNPITATDIGAVGSMMSLLRYAIQPNLVQTVEGQPVLIHTGPFANIAHGCSSVIADRLALGYADYVLTEAGFGADLGFEKFMHIKARSNGLLPSAAVLVATVRALRSHGGTTNDQLDYPDPLAVERGLTNLAQQIAIVQAFGVPVIVTINRFPNDTQTEIAMTKESAEAAGAHAVVESHTFTDGGAGAVDLAKVLLDVTTGTAPKIKYLYSENSTIEEKVKALALQLYGANDVHWDAPARRRLNEFRKHGWDRLPTCMAKTPLSLSHDPSLRGRPTGYTFEISDLRASIGAGFTYPIAGTMMTLPGLPTTPRSLDVDDAGNIVGL